MKALFLISATAMVAACGNSESPAAAPEQTATEAAEASAPAPSPLATSEKSVSATSYIAKAGSGDLWEIESSQTLMANSKNDAVKGFAKMMVDHHNASTAKINAAAAAADIEVSAPKLDDAQKTTLAEIKSAAPDEIDKVYLAHQQKAHEDALALHQAYAANGDVKTLTSAAGEIASVVQSHLDLLAKLDAQSAKPVPK